jgi:hypothetical protein
MKTTIEIADALLRRARAVAARDGDTLRALVEQGLQKVLAERSRRAPGFRLADARVGGRGLDPAFGDATWERLREVIYEGRGA